MAASTTSGSVANTASRTIYRIAPDDLAILGWAAAPLPTIGPPLLGQARCLGFASGRGEDQLEIPGPSQDVHVAAQERRVVVTRLGPLGPVAWLTHDVPAPDAWVDVALVERVVLLVVAPDALPLPTCDIDAVDVLIDAVTRGRAAAALVPLVYEQAIVR